MKFKRYLILSLIIHILPFVLLFHISSPNKSPNTQGTERIEFNPNSEIEVDSIITTPQEGFKRLPGAFKCDHWYGGVGLTHDAIGRILKAPVYYPAGRAGILPNDLLLDNNLKGEIGEPVAINVNRDGKILTFIVKREKICYNKTDEI